MASREASIRVCPRDQNSQDAEWQRRLGKQFSLEKCYTLIKESATHHWKEMWIARLVFPLAFTSTDHTVISPMKRDLLWKWPFGVWLQHQRNPVLHKLASWSFSDTLCCTASGLGFSSTCGLRHSPASFRKFRIFCVCTALLLLPKCNTTSVEFQVGANLPQWSERLFYTK